MSPEPELKRRKRAVIEPLEMGEQDAETPKEDITSQPQATTDDFQAVSVDEKIVSEHEAVKVEPSVKKEGWNLLTVDQQTGKQYRISATGADDGVVAYWRKTRMLSHFKWKLNGKWSDALTRKDIDFIPVYYKEIK